VRLPGRLRIGADPLDLLEPPPFGGAAEVLAQDVAEQVGDALARALRQIFERVVLPVFQDHLRAVHEPRIPAPRGPHRPGGASPGTFGPAAAPRARYKRRVTSASSPRALAHPLPAGLRDLLPEEARRRRALARRLLGHFALHGYQLVTPPAFELAEVLERGLGTLDPSDVLRFVEPESGEVAALRPDMTPQIARMVATRLAGEPRPIRLCYEGTVVRRRQGRARRHRQVPQAGVELYGAPGLAGDVEILRLAASALASAGLTSFVVDLGHAEIARALLDALAPPLAAAIGDALAQKDTSRVAALIAASPSPVPPAIARALAALPDLHGGGEALFARAAPIFAGTAAAGPLQELFALWEAARCADPALAAALHVDLGEVRGFAYYTGAIFHLLAPGPGEPIGAGGRYDDLLARFDEPMPAVGFGLHLDAVTWALEAAGVPDERPPSVLIAGAEAAERQAEALRRLGLTAVAHAPEGAAAYARAWHFTHLVEAGRVLAITAAGLSPVGSSDGSDPEALARLCMGVR
jgi:ATP phosphoribosyltransferase regulatory subunit